VREETVVHNSILDDRVRRLISMGEMAACLAHEMRNPLGGMELYSSLLRRDLKDNKQLLDSVEAI